MKMFFHLALFVFSALAAQAKTSITVLPSQSSRAQVFTQKALSSVIESQFATNDYREVKVQVVPEISRGSQHLLVSLFSKQYHRVDYVRLNVDSQLNVLSRVENYRLADEDFNQQVGIRMDQAHCPDESIEFIAFAPNDFPLEQQITIDVANAAKAKGLKVISLLRQDATHDNYINYMACPNLKGNFYDGDANPQVLATVDGQIKSEEFSSLLKAKFRYKVTNIWLACEAFNDPIRSSLIEDDQSQKYAAGLNDLLVGPSDRAAACTMKAALTGAAMTPAFHDCYTKFDSPQDHWGFDGHGSDYFGQ